MFRIKKMMEGGGGGGGVSVITMSAQHRDVSQLSAQP